MGKIISNGIEYVGLTNINGVFIDTNNVIDSGSYSGTLTYTATEDCFFTGVVTCKATGTGITSYMLINGEQIYSVVNPSNDIQFSAFVKKGQIVTLFESGTTTNFYSVYGIQQGSTNQGSSGGIDYSTTEQKTGQKWINGKDIYQTTVHLESGDFTIGGRTDGISNGLSNVETIITKDAIGIHTNGSGTAYFSNYFATSDGYVCQIFDIGATAFSIYVGSGFSTMTDIYVTFQYTKSTT